jgi:hypothetical protein
MGVVIEICVKYPGGPTRIRVADIYIYIYYIYISATVIQGGPPRPVGSEEAN